MRILWHSNAPFVRTGYGCQTNLTVPRIKAMGHEIAVTAFYGVEGGVLGFGTPQGNIPVYPRGLHPYGIDVMGAHAAHFRADLLITLIDAWVIEPSMIPPGLRWAAYFPIDHEPIPPQVREKVSHAYARIVYSKFGERMCRDAGMDCVYVPHGVDCSVFTPIDRAEARERLGWPKDKFIVGMVAANKGNPSRKALCENITAFAELKKRHRDVFLYLHTVVDTTNGGVNLVEFIESLGLRAGFAGRCNPADVDILFCDQYQNLLGYPDDYMNAAYNAMDVHLLASMGEGFGLPIVEAQAAGCPVIVGGWTSMPELCFSGWTVDKHDALPYWTPLASYQFIPRPSAIARQLRAAYDCAGDADMRSAARKGALEYDADRVAAQYWRPALEEIEGRIQLWKDAEKAQVAT